jgi:hypothetical protein
VSARSPLERMAVRMKLCGEQRMWGRISVARVWERMAAARSGCKQVVGRDDGLGVMLRA